MTRRGGFPGMHVLIAGVAFLLAFDAIPLSQSDGLALVPGGINDPRLNNYFLENIYLAFTQPGRSLFEVDFFYPFPSIQGFGDTLWGVSPPYLLARALGYDPIDSFQLWFLFGYLANFVAARYMLRRLACGDTAATLGALIFAFALPVTAHSGHAQLHYRFGAPLSVGFLLLFLTGRQWRLLGISLAWLTWQYYCSIYTGFFTSLLMFTVLLAALATPLVDANNLRRRLNAWRDAWRTADRRDRRGFIAIALACGMAMGLLFLPYIQVSLIYGYQRPWWEISSMLPKPASYLLADGSAIWGGLSGRFDNIPMRHEHQMFFGVVPWLLALFGVAFSLSKPEEAAGRLMAAGFAILVALTLDLGGFSLWALAASLPLASAIRAMSRIDLIMLLPIAFLAARALDHLSARYRRAASMLLPAIAALMIAEAAMTTTNWTRISDWRYRLVELERQLPASLPANAILFFAQRSAPTADEDIDAMWVALRQGYKTLNGYSGWSPPYFNYHYGNDCREVPRRVQIYLDFSGKGKADPRAYAELMARIVPIGFQACDPAWRTAPPADAPRLDE
jgi:hypothetical protein